MLTQFSTRYAGIGVQGPDKATVEAFLSKYPSGSWMFDDCRILMKRSLVDELEFLRANPFRHKTVVLLLSGWFVPFVVNCPGKRFSGKDTMASYIQAAVTKQEIDCEITHFADVFKSMYSAHSGANLDKLLADREYKVGEFVPVPKISGTTQRENDGLLS